MGTDATRRQSPRPDHEDPSSAHHLLDKYPLSYMQSPRVGSGNLAQNNKILGLKELLCQWEIHTHVYDVHPLDSWGSDVSALKERKPGHWDEEGGAWRSGC